MRSYIFTPKEREIIEGYFRAEVTRGDDIMRQIVLRMKSFKELAADIELYLRLQKRLAES
jgi:hypothetical protein